MRKKIVAGNWKMNMDLAEGLKLASSIDKYFSENPSNKATVIVCTPFIHLAGAHEILKHGKIALGAQNCASEASGAFTGEISAWMVKSTGAEYVIIGHSERRSYYNEDDKTLNKKTLLAINSGLKVIFCCGEVLKEREEKKHFLIVKRQLEEGLFPLSVEQMDKIVIAYEPVWAIGTGLTASPDQAQEMHKYIRDMVKEKYGNECAKKLPVLYGGSCKPSNAAEIFSKPDVDGGLIGGAALNKEDFTAIVEAV
ncbi:MAG: triose-phosphate isomerase [Bacteroidetes bacterium GWE2_41_25]|nr:MAG: triose-phosphate isomerase [Bacteroidetes bacterium GWA2_40_15]OFX85847.1 MAG: triose-phosphate isomerase [Bacteroidetes bacterium GWC2_40_22]OFX97442.1 MAG: triose-phosphate isomerase [Bacteroidetes bacterium GWE2_41_25]OFY58664.1 MAG: triose-phosphate isomerase [Bacteroidetes bacterium GWF2_41_9]HAM09433.1 triose-phosphate isomerase [Bacteroidales bacterium]